MINLGITEKLPSKKHRWTLHQLHDSRRADGVEHRGMHVLAWVFGAARVGKQGRRRGVTGVAVLLDPVGPHGTSLPHAGLLPQYTQLINIEILVVTRPRHPVKQAVQLVLVPHQQPGMGATPDGPHLGPHALGVALVTAKSGGIRSRDTSMNLLQSLHRHGVPGQPHQMGHIRILQRPSSELKPRWFQLAPARVLSVHHVLLPKPKVRPLWCGVALCQVHVHREQRRVSSLEEGPPGRLEKQAGAAHEKEGYFPSGRWRQGVLRALPLTLEGNPVGIDAGILAPYSLVKVLDEAPGRKQQQMQQSHASAPPRKKIKRERLAPTHTSTLSLPSMM
mmetsp:Transcript_60441/g.162153  ORF Transcript_60441/g.162153 Transcript_60441/m.162153 type:complete len:334 (+) Transcript_60441:292-1293(+)